MFLDCVFPSFDCASAGQIVAWSIIHQSLNRQVEMIDDKCGVGRHCIRISWRLLFFVWKGIDRKTIEFLAGAFFTLLSGGKPCSTFGTQ